MLTNPPQAKRRQQSIESNLWVSDITDTDLLNVLDRLDLAEPCYLLQDTKPALLSAMSNTDNLLATNFNSLPTCKCIHSLLRCYSM